MKKILILASTFPRYPADSIRPFIFSLAKKYRQHGLQPVVLTHAFPDTNQKEMMGGVKVYRFRYFFRRWLWLSDPDGIPAALKRRRRAWLLLPLYLIAQFFHIR